MLSLGAKAHAADGSQCEYSARLLSVAATHHTGVRIAHTSLRRQSCDVFPPHTLRLHRHAAQLYACRRCTRGVAHRRADRRVRPPPLRGIAHRSADQHVRPLSRHGGLPCAGTGVPAGMPASGTPRQRCIFSATLHGERKHRMCANASVCSLRRAESAAQTCVPTRANRTNRAALLQYRGRRSSYMIMYTYVLGHFVPVE